MAPGLVHARQLVDPELRLVLTVTEPTELPGQIVERGAGLPADADGDRGEHGPAGQDLVLGDLVEDLPRRGVHEAVVAREPHDPGDLLVGGDPAVARGTQELGHDLVVGRRTSESGRYLSHVRAQ